MSWEWIIAALTLALAAAIWGARAYQRKALQRMRRFDEAAERFATAAHRLLKYEDVPEGIISFADVVNTLLLSPALSGRALMCFFSEPPPAGKKEQEWLDELDEFFKRHPEAKEQFARMVRSGLAAILERSTPLHGWLVRSHLRALNRKHMLRETTVAMNVSSGSCPLKPAHEARAA